MSSNSDVFEYLHPTKRRKLCNSSELINKFSEKSELELVSADITTNLINLKGTFLLYFTIIKFYVVIPFDRGSFISENSKNGGIFHLQGNFTKNK